MSREKNKLSEGQQFGKLTVIERDKNRMDRPYYICQCSCENKTIKSIRKSDLLHKNNPIRSCGCLRYDTIKKKTNKDRDLVVKNTLYLKLKRRHKKLNKDIKDIINFNDFCELIKKECYYCNTSSSNKVKDTLTDYILYCNGLDRRNSKEGYTLDNVVPCCKICNAAKNDMSIQEFKDFIIRVYNYQNNKTNRE